MGRKEDIAKKLDELKELQKKIKNGTEVIAIKEGFYDEGTGFYKRYRPGEKFKLYDDVNTNLITGEQTIKPAGEFFSANWMRLASEPAPVGKTADELGQEGIVPGGPKVQPKKRALIHRKADELKAKEQIVEDEEESPL